MTTRLRDGERLTLNGVEFEAVEDEESRWFGYRCLRCDASFKGDPDDHECDDGPQDDDWINAAYQSGRCGNERSGSAVRS